jgi:hypothetical protein
MRLNLPNNLRPQVGDEIADLRLALFVRCLRGQAASNADEEGCGSEGVGRRGSNQNSSVDHRTCRYRRSRVRKKANEVRAHAVRTLTMKVGQFPVEAALVEEKMDIVTAKDFLSAGKLTRCRRCDAAQALVSHLGNISMIKIERKVEAKVGWSP